MKRFIVFAVVLIATFTLAENAHARGCSISDFTMSPSPPYTLGTHVQLYVKSNCGTVRFEINGKPRAEIGSSEQRETWKTEEFGTGNHEVCAVARGEGGWENADRRCRTVYVEGSQAPPQGSNQGTNVRCWVSSFVVTPGSGPAGTVFNFASQGQCDGNMRAGRYSVGGQAYGEHSTNTYNTNWNSSGFGPGNYRICYLVTAGDWNQAAESCVGVQINSAASPSNDVAQGGQTNNGQPSQSGGNQGTANDSNSACAGSPLPLTAGDLAKVTPGSPNNLRANPATQNSRIVGEIPGGEIFTVVGGPQCGDGYWWWKVDYNGRVGWTAQGSRNESWIEFSISSPRPTPIENQSNTPSNSAGSSGPVSNPTPTIRSTVAPPIDLHSPEAASSATVSGNWCHARVKAVDEGGGTDDDRNYFLHVYLENEPESYTITFLLIPLNLTMWSDEDGYLRFGIYTTLVKVSLGLSLVSDLWAFRYRC